MKDFITPADLARELSVSQLRVRDFLRARHGKLVAPNTRWQLTEAQAREVRAHFRSCS